jgi:hypothetical protein
MVLSEGGDHAMTRLNDTQLLILSAASQRDDGAILPLPDTLKIKGGAVNKVLGSLKSKGLIDHLGTPRGDDPPPLCITRAGVEAIGVESEDDAPEGATPADTGATSAGAGVQAADTGLVTESRRFGHPGEERQGGQRQDQGPQDRVGREAHASRRHQAGAPDRAAEAARGRHGRADRRGHQLAAPYGSGRHLGRAEEKARA